MFSPLGMRDTYLAIKATDEIKGPHGHGYMPDAKGKLSMSTGSTPPPPPTA